MIKRVDLPKKIESKKKVLFSSILKEIQGQGCLSFYLIKTEPKLGTILICSNLEIKGFHMMKKIYLKGSISRRSFIRKLIKQSCSSSTKKTLAVTFERKPYKPKEALRKVKIQSLSKLYLLYDFQFKYGHQIPKQVKNRADTKTSREYGYNYKESYISLLQRELSRSSDLGWPFHTKSTNSSKNHQITSPKPVIDHSPMDRPDWCEDKNTCDVIVSPKSKPGWPLLLISTRTSDSDNSSSECKVIKDEIHENQSELEDLLAKAVSLGVKRFGYAQLKSATSHFSSENKIGEGGYSSVYKGCIEGGKIVAVKVLKPYKEALTDFSLEVNIASSIKHKNIVPLLGICLENGLLISVHDYFPNGTLEDYLHGESNETLLSWEARFNVAVEIAEALNYLHNNDCSLPIIIHRDVKSSNIFLTNELQPQLSDFGLAIWGSEDLVHSDVAGTFGYIAPEYFMFGRVSDKIDIYSFGVVLLELLTGRRPISTKFPKGEKSLVNWARRLLEKGDYEALLDPKLNGDIDNAQMQRMASVARLCISQSPRVRPTASQIIDKLKDHKDANKCLNTKSNYQDNHDNDNQSISEFGLGNQPSFAILDSDNEVIEPSLNDGDTTPLSRKKRTRRLKLKDFLSSGLDED